MPIKQPRTAQELMKDQTIVKHYAGSIAYGTNLPSSDVDFRGIFASDPINVRTPFFTIRETSDSTEEDTKLYELAHFMKLCVDCNPNIVETLWVDQEHIVHTTDAYEHLRQYAPQLLSKKIAFTTSGYAMSQLKRIKGHNKWIVNPQPVDPPKQIDFITMVQWFGDDKVFARDFDITKFKDGWRLVPYNKHLYGMYAMEGASTYSELQSHYPLNVNADDLDRSSIGTPLAVIKFNYDVYQEAKTKWQQYWEWKKNRNEIRSELEEQYGFDTKHAMHLVRLMRMGVEALTEGTIHVKRPDAEELLAIRSGSMTYDEVIQYAEGMDAQIQTLYKTSDLRKSPDLKLAARVLMETQDIIWSQNDYE